MMEPFNRKILGFHLLGMLWTVFFGSFLHFIFEISGYFKPAVLIGAVNESTWEHLKIGFWPAFLFAVLEYYLYGRKYGNFCLAKLINLYSIPVIIIGLFYGYTSFMDHVFFFDIAIFVIAVVFAYWFSYKIIVSQTNYSRFTAAAVIFIILELLAFSLFSYFPPKNFLFLDPQSGLYGIINHPGF